MSKLSTILAKKVFTLSSAAAIFGAVGLAACSDSTGPGGTPYTLREVNGDPIPYLDSSAREGGYQLFKVVGGTLRLNGQNFTASLSVDTGSTVANLRRATTSANGTYTIADTVLTLTVAGTGTPTTVVGSIRADTIRFGDLFDDYDLKLVKR